LIFCPGPSQSVLYVAYGVRMCWFVYTLLRSLTDRSLCCLWSCNCVGILIFCPGPSQSVLYVAYSVRVCWFIYTLLRSVKERFDNVKKCAHKCSLHRHTNRPRTHTHTKHIHTSADSSHQLDPEDLLGPGSAHAVGIIIQIKPGTRSEHPDSHTEDEKSHVDRDIIHDTRASTLKLVVMWRTTHLVCAYMVFADVTQTSVIAPYQCAISGASQMHVGMRVRPLRLKTDTHKTDRHKKLQRRDVAAVSRALSSDGVGRFGDEAGPIGTVVRVDRERNECVVVWDGDMAYAVCRCMDLAEVSL
jgi:hypothetical protein